MMKQPKLSDVKDYRNPVNSECHTATSVPNSRITSSRLGKMYLLDILSWVAITHVFKLTFAEKNPTKLILLCSYSLLPSGQGTVLQRAG